MEAFQQRMAQTHEEFSGLGDPGLYPFFFKSPQSKKDRFNSSYQISPKSKTGLSPTTALRTKSDINWLDNQVTTITQQQPSRNIIVFTHYSPTKLEAASDSKHLDDAAEVNSAFATDISDHICWTAPQVKLWAFGHSHFNCDVEDPQTEKRILANQKGLHRRELVTFDEAKFVRVGPGSENTQISFTEPPISICLSLRKSQYGYLANSKTAMALKNAKKQEVYSGVKTSVASTRELKSSTKGKNDLSLAPCLMAGEQIASAIWLEDLLAYY